MNFRLWFLVVSYVSYLAGTVASRGIESEGRAEHEDRLSPELSRYLSADEIRDFNSNLCYAMVRSLIYSKLQILMQEIPENKRRLLERLCVTYLRSYVINLDQMLRSRVRYDDNLARLENNISIRSDSTFMAKLFSVRAYVLQLFLRDRIPDFMHLDARTRKLAVGLFIPDQRKESIRQLILSMLDITRWFMEAAEEEREQFAELKLKQSNLMRQLVEMTAPLDTAEY